jgi:hypothetical protein
MKVVSIIFSECISVGYAFFYLWDQDQECCQQINFLHGFIGSMTSLDKRQDNWLEVGVDRE